MTKVALVAQGREFLSDGLAELLDQTRLALLHEKKAFLPISKTEKAIELVQEAGKTIPAWADGVDKKEWDIAGELLPVYRNGLVILGFKLEGLRKKEVELKVDPSKTKKKMDLVQLFLKELGDQRDLFQLVEEQNRKQERRGKDAPDPAQQNFLEPGPADGDGVDGKGTPPPKADNVVPLRPRRSNGDDRAAASPAPAE